MFKDTGVVSGQDKVTGEWVYYFSLNPASNAASIAQTDSGRWGQLSLLTSINALLLGNDLKEPNRRAAESLGAQIIRDNLPLPITAVIKS